VTGHGKMRKEHFSFQHDVKPERRKKPRNTKGTEKGREHVKNRGRRNGKRNLGVLRKIGKKDLKTKERFDPQGPPRIINSGRGGEPTKNGSVHRL